MTERELPIDGCVTYWRLSANSNRSLAAEALKPHGLLIDARPETTALREACRELFAEAADHRKDVTYLIRSTAANRNTLAVVQETRQEGARNVYSQEYTVSVVAGRIDSDLEPDQHDELCRRVDAALNRLPAAELASALVTYLDHHGATRLRDGGGIYWMPADRLHGWRRLAHAVEAIGDHTIYMIAHPLDHDSARAVHDAITAEIAAAAEAITAEIAASELGERALEAREDRAAALAAKAAEYENILGQSLARVKELCEQARLAAASARLMASIDSTSVPLFDGVIHGD